MLLVMAMQADPALLIAGLALWVGACTWIGNLQRGLIAYGTVLVGYSASMVALLDPAHPDRVLQLGADRLATLLTGVVVATLVGYFFAQRREMRAIRLFPTAHTLPATACVSRRCRYSGRAGRPLRRAGASPGWN